MIKAVIFDLDGLLLDSEIVAFKVYEELGKRFNFEISLPDFMQNICGQPLRRNVAYVNERFQLPWDLEEAVEEVLRIEKMILDEGVDVMPGARELLAYLKENKYKTAVASSSARERSMRLLEHHNLVEYFDDFVFGPEVKLGKPNPDIFLKAAEKIGVSPECCLVLEDSQAGIQAAYSAGMKVICIPDLKYPTEEFVKKATAIKESLFDVITYLNDNSIYEETLATITELYQEAKLKKGDIVVVGCSTSEVVGSSIGTNSSYDVAGEIFKALHEFTKSKGLFLAIQCCEHLNRAIIIERNALPYAEYVNVVPQPKAGGSLATQAYYGFDNPIAVEEIKADAGLDIGLTLIGMHLKKVAVPLRLVNNKIGEAPVVAARTRPKFIGGVRAAYNDELL